MLFERHRHGHRDWHCQYQTRNSNTRRQSPHCKFFQFPAHWPLAVSLMGNLIAITWLQLASGMKVKEERRGSTTHLSMYICISRIKNFSIRVKPGKSDLLDYLIHIQLNRAPLLTWLECRVSKLSNFKELFGCLILTNPQRTRESGQKPQLI